MRPETDLGSFTGYKAKAHVFRHQGALPLGAPPPLPFHDLDDLVLPGPDGGQAAIQWSLDRLDRYWFNT